MRYVTVSLLKHLSPLLCISIPADAQVYIKYVLVLYIPFLFILFPVKSYVQRYGYNGGDAAGCLGYQAISGASHHTGFPTGVAVVGKDASAQA